MLRIERGEEVGPGSWEYFVRGFPDIAVDRGNRRWDACRQLKSTGGLTGHRVGVFQWVGRGRHFLRDEGRSSNRGFGTVRNRQGNVRPVSRL
jgi:hypothetical protein